MIAKVVAQVTNISISEDWFKSNKQSVENQQSTNIFYNLIIAVAPVENLARTMRRLHLIEFGDYATDVGLNDFLSTNGTFTVFVPENRAFQNISETTE